MKFGIRKPSIKKSISARTTGKAKRKLKRLANPLYGKKGMGLITNPKKSVYNRAYRKTTISAKGASGCIAACIYYPMYYSCLIMWWALKYTAIGLWLLGIFLINCIISLVEFCINLNKDGDMPVDEVVSEPILSFSPIEQEVAQPEEADPASEQVTATPVDTAKPIEYYNTLKAKIKPLENTMVNHAVSLQKIKSVDDRINTLTLLIKAYYALKDKCASLGSDYEEYFTKTWEHCHNSRNPDFNYITRYEQELKKLQSQYTELKPFEAQHSAEAENFQERIIAVLKENPNILQTDVYKQFDPIVKNDVSNILYQLAQDGTISREKSGRTYKINLN